MAFELYKYTQTHKHKHIHTKVYRRTCSNIICYATYLNSDCESANIRECAESEQNTTKKDDKTETTTTNKQKYYISDSSPSYVRRNIYTWGAFEHTELWLSVSYNLDDSCFLFHLCTRKWAHRMHIALWWSYKENEKKRKRAFLYMNVHSV